MEILLELKEIPDDLLDYFEMVNPHAKRDVWTMATANYAGAHFATWPVDLVEFMILAGTSARGCCPTCRAPWRRVMRKTLYQPEERPDDHKGVDASRGDVKRRLDGKSQEWLESSMSEVTIGWRPTCKCYGTPPLPKAPHPKDLSAEAEAVHAERLALLKAWQALPVIPCVVLDPFNGSGTTGEVSMKNRRDYIGLDLNLDYFTLARQRTRAVQQAAF